MIQLPWVSRRAYNDQRDRIAGLLADLSCAMDREEKWAVRHDALLLQYTTMASRAVPEPVKLPERTKDEVIEAIHARAGTNGQVRACLSSWAMQQRRNKVPDDQIITGIMVWASDDDDGTSSDGML